MIADFVVKETELVWRGTYSRKLPQDIQKTALRKLRMLNNAKRLDDLKVPPNNHLEALKRDQNGQHSIRINDQWRICFVWTEGGPTQLPIQIKQVRWLDQFPSCPDLIRAPTWQPHNILF